jgi:hypothetical protein
MAKDRELYGTGELLRDLEVWERVARLPDDFPLAPKQAAVLMTFSERTLQAWRKSGTGPAYFQGGLRVEPNGAPPPDGTNQHVRYFKADIAAWWEKNKVSNVTMAATLKGQTFVTTLQHVVQEAAFYVDSQGQIEGMVENGSLGELLDADEERIVWLPVSDAASRKWADLAKHKELADQVRRALSDARASVEGGLEATEIASVAAEGRKRKPTSS